MALAEGTRLGPYEIVSPVGAGGMGEVYRARDTRLDRMVAIKVLAEGLAADLHLKQRLESEARTISQLTHPNICPLYDVGEHDGAAFLVMELLQGETLAARLARGPLPCDEALTVAVQIASALDAAHRTGVFHRDLKPANIFLSRAAAAAPTAKILDFGLAKSNGPVVKGAARRMLSTVAPRLTEPNVILGTVGYMAPEQIEGLEADARTDIFAFGTVLYEMLAGQRAFLGTTPATLMAAILQTTPPPVSTKGPISARALDRVVQKCLAKSPDDRWQSARDLRDELAWLATLDAGALDANTVARTMIGGSKGWRRAVLWAAAGAVGSMAVLSWWAPWRRPALSSQPLRVSAALGVDAALTIDVGAMSTAAVLSPDGSLLAFVAQSGTGAAPQLYIRRLDELQATQLSGTDGAHTPFFSPDGQWLAFFADGQLKKVSVTGGAAIVLCKAANGRGGAWGEDGTIYISPDNQPYVRLARVSSTGGTAEPLPAPAEPEWHQRWPQVIGNRAVLYTVNDAVGLDDAHLVVQALPDGPRKIVYRGGYHGRYVDSGHLLYMGDGALRAVPFDIDRLEVTGSPVVVVDGVMSSMSSGGAQFAVSSSGTLAYMPGPTTSSAMPVHWMNRLGETTPLQANPANWFNLRFDHDGRRLAMGICDGPGCDIWIHDWVRGRSTRMTLDAASGGEAVWTPDGRRFAFSSTRDNQSTANLYWQGADRTGQAERLTHSENPQAASSWHPNGRWLAFEERTPQTQADVMILPMEGSEASGWKPGQPSVFLNSPSAEREPMFSPDGRWVAFHSSNESGHSEVYVRPFERAGDALLISAGGGSYPTWSQAKHELFYGTPTGQIMVVSYAVSGSVFKADGPQPWSEGRYMVRGPNRMFDVHPDGERFAVAPAVRSQEGVDMDHVTLVFNLFDQLRRLAPATAR